jgi:hypothetical protein
MTMGALRSSVRHRSTAVNRTRPQYMEKRFTVDPPYPGG